MEAAVLKGLLTKEFDSVRGEAGAGHTTICADVSTVIICALFSALLCALCVHYFLHYYVHYLCTIFVHYFVQMFPL